MWYDKIIANLDTPQIINDSKTPSGRVHVGSLRGVLIHDAVFRALQQKGNQVTYLYGVDDYDPLDGLPSDATNDMKQYMGMPLCQIPAPEGSTATDLADHYIREFLQIFTELGVKAKTYRMRDIYRSGEFNQAIDQILSQADKVRQVYLDVSRSKRPDNWYPFQVVCEQCGKVGTTQVIAYDGKEVSYQCLPALVSWASGCGHQGKVSPFDGNGKLPWKLEWVAKWSQFGISIEGAGKDHCTKGGSRDVASRCLQRLFGLQPPINIPYEFFLVEGAKMSSSKGIGTSAREMADFLPPEILRFLMIRTAPKKTVNFSTDAEYMLKLFNEHDKLLQLKQAGKLSQEGEGILNMVEVEAHHSDYRPVSFQLITALMQLLHVNIEQEVIQRMGGEMTEVERMHLQQRIKSAKHWLDNYAADEDRLELKSELPNSAHNLSVVQKGFLNLLAKTLQQKTCADEQQYQSLLFEVARLTPIEQKYAFVAIYRVLLDRTSGPKGGSLLSFLSPDFLIQRFQSLDYSVLEFYQATAKTLVQVKQWLEQQKTTPEILSNTVITIESQLFLEIKLQLQANKPQLLRVVLADITEQEQVMTLFKSA